MKLVSINTKALRSYSFSHPPIRIVTSKTDQNPIHANEIEIIGPAFLRHDPTAQKILPGSHLVIECADVIIIKE